MTSEILDHAKTKDTACVFFKCGYIQYNKKHCVSPKVKSTIEMIIYE